MFLVTVEHLLLSEIQEEGIVNDISFSYILGSETRKGCKNKRTVKTCLLYFLCFTKSFSETMNDTFYFIQKPLFVLEIFIFFCIFSSSTVSRIKRSDETGIFMTS